MSQAEVTTTALLYKWSQSWVDVILIESYCCQTSPCCLQHKDWCMMRLEHVWLWWGVLDLLLSSLLPSPLLVEVSTLAWRIQLCCSYSVWERERGRRWDEVSLSPRLLCLSEHIHTKHMKLEPYLSIHIITLQLKYINSLCCCRSTVHLPRQINDFPQKIISLVYFTLITSVEVCCRCLGFELFFMSIKTLFVGLWTWSLQWNVY